MNADNLKKILADHKLWVESGNQSGNNGADLNGADLHYANLTGADLTGAHLHGADLHGAYLTRAILHGADLSYADLTGAHFQLEFKSVRYFRNAIFSEAAIPWVILNPHWTEYADTVTFV